MGFDDLLMQHNSLVQDGVFKNFSLVNFEKLVSTFDYL